MTHHVRDSYRQHRKATLGAGDGLWLSRRGHRHPARERGTGQDLHVSRRPSTQRRVRRVTPTAQNLCGREHTSVTLRTRIAADTLGSAEVYFPAGWRSLGRVVRWALRASSTSPHLDGTKDIVARFDNLNMAPRRTRTVTVTFKTTANFSTSGHRGVKQSNNFNDSGGGANLFTVQGGFPTLRVVQCVTVSGRVYQDRNLDNTYTTGTGAFLNSDVPKAWTVKLFGKDAGAPASSYALVAQTTSTRSEQPGPGQVHVHAGAGPARLQAVRHRGRYGRVIEVGAADPDRKLRVRPDLEPEARPRRPPTAFRISARTR